MRNIKLTLEYDGSGFFGFQRQKDRPTIQAALEQALSKLFNQPMKIAAAAGRTDSGVHARGQVVNFKCPLTLPSSHRGEGGRKQRAGLSLDKIQRGLNALLPEEIVVTKIEEARPDFHARYNARAKIYEYLVFNSEIRSPLLNGRAYQFSDPLDWAKMKKAGRKLVGRRDFKAFQASGSTPHPNPLPLKGRGSVRTIRRFTLERKGNLIRFTLEADGFLYHMVRNIVGTLLEVGRRNLSLEEFSEVLKSRNRVLAGPTVPAQGLTLLSVKY